MWAVAARSCAGMADVLSSVIGPWSLKPLSNSSAMPPLPVALHDYRTWSWGQRAVFAFVVLFGYELLHRVVPLLFSGFPQLPWKGKHLDELEFKDKLFIGFNRITGTPRAGAPREYGGARQRDGGRWRTCTRGGVARHSVCCAQAGDAGCVRNHARTPLRTGVARHSPLTLRARARATPVGAVWLALACCRRHLRVQLPAVHEPEPHGEVATLGNDAYEHRRRATGACALYRRRRCAARPRAPRRGRVLTRWLARRAHARAERRPCSSSTTFSTACGIGSCTYALFTRGSTSTTTSRWCPRAATSTR